MTLPRIDKDIPEPLPGNGNSEVNPYYKISDNKTIHTPWYKIPLEKVEWKIQEILPKKN